MAKNGLHLITPTSIAYTGTSASISANGSVSFSAVSTLSLNGVFSADYDNYVMMFWGISSASPATVYGRYRASGTDDATASSYTRQFLYATGTSVGGLRSSADYLAEVMRCYSVMTGCQMSVYGPYLAQPTAFRSVTVSDNSGAYIVDHAVTHNQSTSYDGFTLYPNTGTISGRIAVYGLRK